MFLCTVAQNLMLTDDGTVLAELDMRLTHDQFFNMYEQPVYDRYLFCHFIILTHAMLAVYCDRVMVTAVLHTYYRATKLSAMVT